MDERLRRKMIRKDFSKQGWTLVIYYGIMNVAVMLCIFVDTIIRTVSSIMEDGLYAGLDQSDIESLMGNGWGYILACAVGFLILLLWKGKKFTFGEVWTKGKAMKARDFFPILCIFMSAQVLFQMLSVILEYILNLFGLSAMAAMEAATISVDTISMFLYMAVLAPITEEILFRGLILRSLRPYGKKLAIFVSAFLFGIFHGNIVQSPFAFAVGLVLGYVAMEYSIAWAMVLHMFNNLVISDLLTRLTAQLSVVSANLISMAVIYGFAVAGVVFAVVKRRKISQYLRRERMNPYYLKCCFSSPGVIVLMVLMGISLILSITLL